jgi:RNA ligase-like protein
MSSWSSYPSIYNLGHRAVRSLLDYPHVVEEKVDGSQFSFGYFEVIDTELDTDPVWELRIRSKGAVMVPEAPEKMFAKAVESVKARIDKLHPNWTYRAEYLQKPKHNTLAYDRVPEGNLIIFDVSTGDQQWLLPAAKKFEANRIGLECVPVLNLDVDDLKLRNVTLDLLRAYLDGTKSILGGQLIEGVVIKPLVELYGVDKKTLMGKFVSERFKEAHKVEWKETNPQSGDILTKLEQAYKHEGRWLKAVQHLQEAGKLQDAPQDIPSLIAEVQKDLGKEEEEAIKQILWKWAWPKISRASIKGLPEWYKERLLRLQFEEEPRDDENSNAV